MRYRHERLISALILFLTTSLKLIQISSMTSKLIPTNPSDVMVIRKVTPNITICSTPFNRFGRFKIGGRGTIGDLPNQCPEYHI